MANGGKRPGAGRKPGSKSKKTLEKLAIQEAFNQRVLTHADRIFQAQLSLAVGSVQVFRVDEEEDEKGKVKRIHTLVTNPDEIKDVLDTNEGEAGVVGENYYFVSNVLPQNAAAEALLNRTLGKAKDSLDLNVTGNLEIDQVLKPKL